jgi:hypothetical protein
MLDPVLQEFNFQIIASIKNLKFNLKKDKNVLNFVKQYIETYDKINFLGNFGLRLYELLNNIDYDHPEASKFLKNLLGNNCLQEILQIIEIVKFLKRKKFDSFLEKIQYLPSLFKKDNLLLKGRTIDDPFLTNIHIRFLDKDSINQCRNKKKRQVISNWKNYVSPISEQDNLDILECYHHNSLKTKDVICQLNKRKQIFVEMKCLQMVAEIDDAIEKLDQESLDNNFGFRRITLSSVANAYRELFKSDDDILIIPITKELVEINTDVGSFVNLCDNLSQLNGYSIFDHYGLVGSIKNGNFIIVGERDTQTFFIGYASHE